MTRCALTALALTIASPLAAQTDLPLLTMLDGVAPGFEATLSLAEPGVVRGHAPCNSYSAPLIGTLPTFRVEAITATEMACEALAFEQPFFELLLLMDHAEQVDNVLTLTGAGHVMEFSSRP